MSNRLTRVRALGRKASLRDYPITVNPYERESVEWYAWNKAYKNEEWTAATWYDPKKRKVCGKP